MLLNRKPTPNPQSRPFSFRTFTHYIFLTRDKKAPDYIARNKVARKQAILVCGILKHGKPFNLEQFGGKQKPTPSDLESLTL